MITKAAITMYICPCALFQQGNRKN